MIIFFVESKPWKLLQFITKPCYSFDRELDMYRVRPVLGKYQFLVKQNNVNYDTQDE